MRILAFLLVLVGLSASPAMAAPEFFGEFRDPLEGRFVDAQPRPMFKLAAQFRFVDPNGLLWIVPPGKEVDGASIPQAFWSFIGGPFEGAYIKASVIHDHYCNEKSRTEHDTHRNFYYGMRANGVEEWKAKFMYWAVATFGPKWKLDKRVAQNLKCNPMGDKIFCTGLPEVKLTISSLPTIDLNDPDTLALALSKASTVARSLKTSNGKVLDISASGQVGASLDDIAKNADQYRSVFSTRDYGKSAAKLGVLSQWNVSGLDQVKAWDNSEMPRYNAAVVLTPDTVKKVQSGKYFKLDANSGALLGDQLDLKSLEIKSEHSR